MAGQSVHPAVGSVIFPTTNEHNTSPAVFAKKRPEVWTQTCDTKHKKRPAQIDPCTRTHP